MLLPQRRDGSTTIDVSTDGGPLLVDNGDPTTDCVIEGTGTLGGVIFVNGNLNFNNGSNITLGTIYSTTLTSNVDIGDTTLLVASTNNFPSSGTLIVGTGGSEENLEYTKVNSTTFSIEATTKTHYDGDPVSIENGQTIFVTGNITMDTHVTLNGPGAVIAIGDIDFQPNLGNDSYIMVLSLDGTICFQPQNLEVFHGSVAAAEGVDFQTNVTIDCTGAEGFGLNIPGSTGTELGGIVSWIIN